MLPWASQGSYSAWHMSSVFLKSGHTDSLVYFNIQLWVIRGQIVKQATLGIRGSPGSTLNCCSALKVGDVKWLDWEMGGEESYAINWELSIGSLSLLQCIPAGSPGHGEVREDRGLGCRFFRERDGFRHQEGPASHEEGCHWASEYIHLVHLLLQGRTVFINVTGAMPKARLLLNA